MLRFFGRHRTSALLDQTTRRVYITRFLVCLITKEAIYVIVSVMNKYFLLILSGAINLHPSRKNF